MRGNSLLYYFKRILSLEENCSPYNEEFAELFTLSIFMFSGDYHWSVS
jgi:hypothetical protein